MNAKQVLVLLAFCVGVVVLTLTFGTLTIIPWVGGAIALPLILFAVWPLTQSTEERGLGSAVEALKAIELPPPHQIPEVDQSPVLINEDNDPLNPLRALSPEIDKLIDYRDELIALKHELDAAKSVQSNMLPDAATMPPFLEVESRIVPSLSMSGDFFDYYTAGHNRVSALIADVSDKGLPSAIFASKANGLIRVIGNQIQDAGAILSEANRHLCARNAESLFVTLVYATFDLETQRLSLSNAGHEPPILIKADGTTRWLEDTPNLPLGLDPDHDYSTIRAEFLPGDTLVLYTDGLTEAVNDDGVMVTRQRIFDTLGECQDLTPAEIVATVYALVDASEPESKASDDRTMVVMRRTEQ